MRGCHTAASVNFCSPRPNCVAEAGARKQDKPEGDRDVDERTGDGDQELLAGLFGNALEPSNAADWQQRDIRRGDAESARREDMAEFMRENAGEQQEHEEEAFGVYKTPC